MTHPSVAEPEGIPKRYVRKKIRRCRACGKKLSQYNENKYCFVHVITGWKLELAQAEQKKFDSYQKHLKKMKAEKKRKKK